MRWRGSDGGRGRGTYGGGLMPGAASVPVSSGEGVAAIVVTHESAATIDDCLARLRAARGVSQVRVVDNGSRDDTLAIVQRHAAPDPRCHFIANPHTPAFAETESATCWERGGQYDYISV